MHPIRADRRAAPFVPHARVFAEKVIVSRTEGLAYKSEELTVPLVALSFDYAGARVRGDDDSPTSGVIVIDRDREGETRARRAIERLGAVELSCLESIAAPAGCEADYVVRVDGDAHAYCDFTNRLLALTDEGWQVTIDADYPFRVLARDVPWYAAVAPADEDDAQGDWFSLELGVEVGGERVDLLPMVVELLDELDQEDGLRAVLRRPSYALAVGVQDHVTLSRERLALLLQVVVELYQGGCAAFPAARAGALARLEVAFENEGTRLTLSDPAGVVERSRRLSRPPEPVETPKTLRADLRPYQRDGVAFLQHLAKAGAGGVLADDMGLGKTLQTIAHLCLEKASGRMSAPALIVAPTSLVGNWARELLRFAPHLKVTVLHGAARRTKFAAAMESDVVVTTYPLVLRDEEHFADACFHLLVLDEAQAIKNARSQAHRALCRVQADHRLCLTGTPVENHTGELWALFNFLSPGLLGDELAFRRAYRKPIEERRDEGRLQALREQIAPFVLRRTKGEVARDLPSKTDLYRPVELAGAQRELYENIRVAAHADVRKVIRVRGLAQSTIPILGALMKLRQVCCDPRLVAMDSARSVRESAKYDALFDLLETQLPNGHRVLVFSQFTTMLGLIAEGLRQRNVPYLSLTGETRERQRVVDAFEAGRADVFLISLKAGGTGLNLVSADTVVHYDPWWNPAAQAQATDRAHRIGQQRPVFVHNLFVAGSVEERVMRMQQHKRWLSESLLGDGAGAPALAEEDVEELFAPLED